jgi:hypothetical protein
MRIIVVSILLTLLIQFPAGASLAPDKSIHDQIKDLVLKYSPIYDVDPPFALAVFHIESRIGNQEFRVGPMGRGTFYGPAGIHKSFLKDRGWPINTLEGNIRVGVRALQGTGVSRDKQVRRLHRYNAVCDSRYVGAVMRAKAKYERELKCDRPTN